MLHILLLILKIIGIIIAVILGILVLLVCVVLFVPVRYDLRAASDGTFAKTRMEAKATWLLHLVRFRLCYEDKKLSWQVRVAWKKIQSGQEGKKTIEAEVETHDEELEDDWEGIEEEAGEEELGTVSEEAGEGHRKALEEKRETAEERRECVAEGLKEEKKVREEADGNFEHASKEPERLVDELQREMEKILETEKKQMDVKDHREECKMDCEECGEEREEDCEGSEEERSGIWQKITGFCQGIFQKIAGLYHKITAIPGKVSGTLHGIGDKVQGLLEKKDKILGFLSDEIHQTAFMKARDEIFFLLRRLKPKTIEADIHFGFEDPSLTGKALAGVSMCYPFLGDGVNICPDFEKRIFDGNLRIVGRIRASYFLKLLWKLLWSREVRMTYRHVRSFEL